MQARVCPDPSREFPSPALKLGAGMRMVAGEFLFDVSCVCFSARPTIDSWLAGFSEVPTFAAQLQQKRPCAEGDFARGGLRTRENMEGRVANLFSLETTNL